MQQNYNFRGGALYTAPSVEVYEVSVERGFLTSPLTNYDEEDGTESGGSDSESTKW